jgi:hypothetical protein
MAVPSRFSIKNATATMNATNCDRLPDAWLIERFMLSGDALERKQRLRALPPPGFAELTGYFARWLT